MGWGLLPPPDQINDSGSTPVGYCSCIEMKNNNCLEMGMIRIKLSKCPDLVFSLFKIGMTSQINLTLPTLHFHVI